MQVECYCDATYQPNSSSAYYGFIIITPNKKYGDIGKLRGDIARDNTRAEFRGLEKLIDKVESYFSNSRVLVRMDSKPIVEILSGISSARKEDLQKMYNRIKETEKNSSNKYRYKFVKRFKNQEADRLASEAKRSDNKKEYKNSFNKNWLVRRRSSTAYDILSEKNKVICKINTHNNSCSCINSTDTKCRHRFFLDRMLNKDRTHKIVED